MNIQKRNELENKIKQCNLNLLAKYMNKSERDYEFCIVYLQRCDLLRQYRENYGEEAYDQLRGRLDEARDDYIYIHELKLNNFLLRI